MVEPRRIIRRAISRWRSERCASPSNIVWFAALLGLMAGRDYLSGDTFLSRFIWLVPPFAVAAAAITLLILSRFRIYHPPGVALSMYPLLLHPGHLFSVVVVLPFTTVAVVSSALPSRRFACWPRYPLPLDDPAPDTTAESRAAEDTDQ